MKYNTIAKICAVTVLCMSFQMQPVCAQEMTGEAVALLAEGVQAGEGTTEENPEEEAANGNSPAEDVSAEDAPAGDAPTKDTAAEETETPQKEAPEENTPPKKTVKTEHAKGTHVKKKGKTRVMLPLPEAVTGLHTTCQSNQRALLEWNKSEGAAYYEVYRRKGAGAYSKLGVSKETSYIDTSASYGQTFDYKVIPFNRYNEKGKEATIRLSHIQAVNIVTQKYTFNQMEIDMNELAKQYSDYCTLTQIGTSAGGRKIYDFAIGNPNAKESLLVVSTLHAREYICSVVLMQEIEYYLRYYHCSLSGSTPATVLSNLQIHYVVMSNPDGVTISQTTAPRWKANGQGVDLNRNFPAHKFVVVGKRGPEGYSGLKALSEPESRAIATLTNNLIKNQHLLGVVNYHAMGQIIYGGCADPKIKRNTQLMYSIARNLTGYRDAGGSYEKAIADGSYREYVMYLLGIPSITLEVGSTMAPCQYWEYASAFQKNKLVVLKIAEAL